MTLDELGAALAAGPDGRCLYCRGEIPDGALVHLLGEWLVHPECLREIPPVVRRMLRDGEGKP